AAYRRLRGLYATRPDAIVVTGGERTAPALAEEPLWEPLAELCDWAPKHTTSMVLSGLAAHLAAHHFEGLEPRRMVRKRRTPEPDHVDTTHVLGRDLPATVSASCAGGEIPLSAMLARGYEPVLAGGDHWTVVTAARETCLLVLVQGLAEHGPDQPAGRGLSWADALSANWLEEVSRRAAEEVRFSGVAAPLVAG
ncbi:MAG: homoserine O-acetyltransferase/O-succinyltransferase family protein, partial [Solirubrobacteraceae bacterium]